MKTLNYKYFINIKVLATRFYDFLDLRDLANSIYLMNLVVRAVKAIKDCYIFYLLRISTTFKQTTLVSASELTYSVNCMCESGMSTSQRSDFMLRSDSYISCDDTHKE